MNGDIESLSLEYPDEEIAIANIAFDKLELCPSNRFPDVPPLGSWIVEIVEIVQADHPMAFPK
jgi:hypothetical protein